MNITFLIGNGFDLNLGLETRYSDFYKYYMRHNPNDIISKSIEDQYELWADLEIGLGAFLKNIDDSQIDEFLDAKGKLEQLLSDYLTLEGSRVKISNSVDLAKEFQKNILNFFAGFNTVEKNNYHSCVSGISEAIKYSFITFNYTDALDKIVAAVKKECQTFGNHTSGNTRYTDTIETPFHIHGKLTEDLILGLDNADQILNENLKANPRLANYIIKAEVNKSLGEMKVENAKSIIDHSRYICLFGLSIGDTDAMWWSYIIQWLNQNPKNRLVLFVNENTLVQLSGQEKIRFRDAKRNNMLTKSKITDSKIMAAVRDRIIIVPNSTIFTLKNIEIQPKEPEGEKE